MRPLTCLALFTILALLAINLAPAHAISSPNYLPGEYPDTAPGLVSAYGQKLVIYSSARGSISILDPETGESRVFPAPRDVRDMEVSGKWLALAPTALQKLLLYDLESGEAREIELPGEPYAIEVANGLFLVSIPDEVAVIDPDSAQVLRQIEVAAFRGAGAISAHGQRLWVIGSDRKTVYWFDLGGGGSGSGRMDVELVAIRAFAGGIVAATSQDEVLKLSQGLRIEGKWALESGSSIDIALYVTPDGRIIYVSPSRWVIGEIEGSEKREVKVGGRIFSSTLLGDAIYFTETNSYRIGYVPLSRPPRIQDFRVERVGEDTFKASAKALDPDGDLSRVVLIVLYEGIMGPAQNQTIEMENVGGDLYAATINLKYQRAEIHAVAVDKYNNVAKSESVRVEIQQVWTITETRQTTAETQTHIDIYALGSSMLLLVPIIIAVLYFVLKPKKRRKGKK